MTNYKVGIVIPFYNGDDVILPCLESIAANNYSDMTVYLVNNSDKPTNVQAIAERNKGIRVVNANPRMGFAKANNMGAALAIAEGAEIVMGLNQDIVLNNECIEHLLYPFEVDSDISMTAPVLFTYDFMNIEDGFVRDYLSQCPDMIFDALSHSLKEMYTMKLIMCACFAIRASTIKEIGFFDPLYFMYYDDNDLCRKIISAKKKIVMVPQALAAHEHAHATHNPSDNWRRHRWSRDSRFIYILKDLNRSLPINCLKLARDISYDYIRLLVEKDFRKLLNCVMDDLKMIPKLRRIIQSRNSEKMMLRRVQCYHSRERVLL
jgi:GT2 family glycosyltransferase